MPNRTLCDALTEIRKCVKTGNYSYLPGLVEEIQSMANRMEAALWDQKTFEREKKDYKKLKKKVAELEEKLDES